MGIHVFEVRKIDVHESFEAPQRLYTLVTTAVVDHCGSESALADGF
jgi:hypothetical protein